MDTPETQTNAPDRAKGKSDYIIEVRHLRKSFGDREVLSDINVKIPRGKTTVIMGGSGCGKSTLLKHMIGLLRPESGEVFFDGMPMSTISDGDMDKLRKRFGVLFQSAALFNSMTVGENVALPMREHSGLDEHIIDIVVKMKLEMVGLRGFEGLMPSHLSGGMKKRVGLARAIALEPDAVFYDEPSAGLDPIVVAVIDQLMMDLSGKLGITSVVVTHDMTSAFRIADKMVMLYLGEVIAEGNAYDIRNSADPRVQQFIHGSPDGPIPLRRSKGDYMDDLIAAATPGPR